MMRQISIGETGIVSKEHEMYYKENERKKKKKELKKKEECEALKVGEYMIITGGTKGVIGDIVYSTRVTSKSVFVNDINGENFLKRKEHLKKMKLFKVN
jgi:preprotein translocase subunit YajC